MDRGRTVFLSQVLCASCCVYRLQGGEKQSPKSTLTPEKKHTLKDEAFPVISFQSSITSGNFCVSCCDWTLRGDACGVGPGPPVSWNRWLLHTDPNKAVMVLACEHSTGEPFYTKRKCFLVVMWKINFCSALLFILDTVYLLFGLLVKGSLLFLIWPPSRTLPPKYRVCATELSA